MGHVSVGGVSFDFGPLSVPVDTREFDYSDRSSNVEAVWTANVSLISLVGLFVGLRIFVRSYVMRKIFKDDVLIVIASVFTIALASVCLCATRNGLGTHVWLLPVETVLDTIKQCIQSLFVCQVLYACAIAFTKVAIIASYLRFIPNRKFRIALVITGIIIAGQWVTGIFVTIFQCRPVHAAWDFTVHDGVCIDFIGYLYASSAISITTDIILCVLPWPYLWKLRMPIRQKIILCLLLGGGAGACIAGIIRLAKLDTLRSADMTYQCVWCLNMSVVECSLGIICVSIPPLRPLMARIFPRAFDTDQSTNEISPFQTLRRGRRARAVQADAALSKEIGEEDIADNINEYDSGTEPEGPAETVEKAIETRNGPRAAEEINPQDNHRT